MQRLYITYDENKINLLKKIRSKQEDAQVMGIKEFFKQYFFDYNEETLFFLTNKYHIKRHIARMYLKHLYFLKDINKENEKITFLKELKETCRDYLKVNPFFKNYLQKYNLVIYHIPVNKFLNNIIEELKKITTITIMQIPSKKRKIKIFEAEDVFLEVTFICNEIRKLIANNVSYDNIYIANTNQEYQNALTLYGNLYNLEFQFLNKENIYSTAIVTYFLEHIEEDWPQLFLNLKEMIKTEKENQIYQTLVDFVNTYIDFPKTNETYEYLKEAIKNISINIDKQRVIKEIDITLNEVNEDDYIFFMNTNLGEMKFEKVDSDYFNDIERFYLNIGSYNEENELIKKELINNLNYYNNLVISYHQQSSYPSSILENLDKEYITFTNNYNYSHLYNKLMYAAKMDNYLNYGVIDDDLKILGSYQNIEYRKYNNQFKPFKIDKLPINTLSYTGMDLYTKCPFRFYLTYILKINKKEKEFPLLIGQIFHEALQKYYQKDFDLKKYFEMKIRGQDYSKKQLFFLKKLYKQIEYCLQILKEQEQYQSLKNVLCEQEIKVVLDDNFIFKGVIDKIFYDDEYLSIIDYKTGSFNTNLNFIKLGINLQLPIYLYLIKHSLYQNLEIVGFYYQKIIPSIPLKDFVNTYDDLLKKEYMLQGYSNSNIEALQKFDNNYQNSHLIKGMKISSKGFYHYTKVFDEKKVNNLIKIVEEKILEFKENIEKQRFNIEPKRINGQLISCEYCPYENICYKKEEDIKNIIYKEGELDGLDQRTTTGV